MKQPENPLSYSRDAAEFSAHASWPFAEAWRRTSQVGFWISHKRLMSAHCGLEGKSWKALLVCPFGSGIQMQVLLRAQLLFS
jgi:hypothetical protein